MPYDKECCSGAGGGGTPPPPPTPTRRYLLVSTDRDFAAAEVVSGPADGRVVAIPADAVPDGQRRYIGVARPATEGTFDSVFIYATGNRNTLNQIAAWQNQAATLELETGVQFQVLGSVVSQRSSINGFNVEAT